MLTQDQARAIAQAEIERKNQGPFLRDEKLEFVIWDEYTLAKDFGWVFFYHYRQFIETGEFKYRLAGNAPLIVNKFDGSLHVTGMGRPTEHYINEYRQLWQRAQLYNKLLAEPRS